MTIRKLWPAFAWALAILILTGFPGDFFPTVNTFWEWLSPDKLLHVFIFGTLSFLIFFNLRDRYFISRHRYRFIITVVGITLAYGLLTEVLQDTVFIRRDGNLFDFLADSLGAVAGWALFHLMFRKKIE